MGEPDRGHALSPPPERIGREEATRGTETSKYPEERKSTEIALVAASERAPSPNPCTCKPHGVAARGLRGRMSESVRARARSETMVVAERHGKAGRRG